MTNFEIYNANKVDKGNVWITFLFLGWSYGSLGQMGKQILFYLTLGGVGLWTLYTLFTLNSKIDKYNKQIAVESGLSTEDLIRLNLI